MSDPEHVSDLVARLMRFRSRLAAQHRTADLVVLDQAIADARGQGEMQERLAPASPPANSVR